jgi:hypothetical protein
MPPAPLEELPPVLTGFGGAVPSGETVQLCVAKPAAARQTPARTTRIHRAMFAMWN